VPRRLVARIVPALAAGLAGEGREERPGVAVVAALAVGVGLSIDRATAIGPGAAAKPGMAAPVFSAPDIAGKTVSLGDYAGKIVILEWTNDGCPFVGKHYDSGNMQALQRKYTGEGDVWLTIASSAPGEQGYVAPAEAKAEPAAAAAPVVATPVEPVEPMAPEQS